MPAKAGISAASIAVFPDRCPHYRIYTSDRIPATGNIERAMDDAQQCQASLSITDW
jgi:hypothetical protein